MWGKIMAGAVGLLAFALAAFFGHQLIAAYGAARQTAGRAEAEAAQLPAIIAANAASTNAALAARDRVIAADSVHAKELGRLLPLALSANDKVNAYAQTDAGGAPCLATDRVRDIESDRNALFSEPASPTSHAARSMPSDLLTDEAGPQP